MLGKVCRSGSSCAITVIAIAFVARAQSHVVAWGDNSYGQFNAPVPPAGTSYVEVKAGDSHVVARRSDGAVIAWGDNGSGQCNVPSIAPGVDAVEVAAGAWHSLARLSDGSVIAWGDSQFGQCSVPALPTGVTYVHISAGAIHNAACRSDGHVVAWGNNDSGQLDVPALPPGKTFVDVAAGGLGYYCTSGHHNHLVWVGWTVAVVNDGTITGWGEGTYGACTAPSLPSGVTFQDITAGGRSYLNPYCPGGWGVAGAQCSDGVLRVWGDNTYGQSAVPTLPPSVAFLRVSLGTKHAVALRSDGLVSAWGDNSSGECNVPVLQAGHIFTDVSAGEWFSIALAAPDCNGNGIEDVLDITSGGSADCNANSIPDECDLGLGAVFDCDSNGLIDSCEIAGHPALDCNSNGILDLCDLAQGATFDCDGNGQIDSCEIASNPALDLDHNAVLDRCQQAGTAYCFGDGSGHTCPCDPGQVGTTGHGCANSTGEGAILSGTGAISVTGDSLQLHVSNMPNPTTVLFIQGTIQQNGGQGSFGGDGLLCVNGPAGMLIRLGAHAAQPGASDFGYGIGSDPLISVRGQIPAIGATRYYQAYYRDNSAFCTGLTYNFSNGMAITWAP